MSSLQLNYPEKISLKGREVHLSKNLKKGPKKEIILLESHKIQIKRNEYALQPILTTGFSTKIESLAVTIPLSEKWTPLIHRAYNEAYTSLFLKNGTCSSSLQIFRNPDNQGMVKIKLSPGGRAVVISWIIDRKVEAQEELPLPVIHFSQNDGKIIPVKYSFKEKKSPSLNRGRLFSFSGKPDIQRISRDLQETAKQGLTFDFYLLDYGTVPLWGDWTNLSAGIMDKFPLITNEIRRNGMLPGICLSPLSAEKKSQAAQNGLTLNKGPALSILVGGKIKKIAPMDITLEEVRANLKKTLDLYSQWGFKYFHFDHLDFLLDSGSWHDESKGPLDRMALLTGLLRPYKERGILFSASCFPLMGAMDFFDVITPAMVGRKGRLTNREWQNYSLMIELAMVIKNPPLLSLGGLSFNREKNKLLCKHNRIYHNSQALLNGPAILSQEYELIDETTISLWTELAKDKKTPLLPLDFSPHGFSQDVLLFINRSKCVAIFNLSGKKRVVHLFEGDLGDSKGLSPSQSTALKSGELILPMGSESSHLFQI